LNSPVFPLIIYDSTQISIYYYYYKLQLRRWCTFANINYFRSLLFKSCRIMIGMSVVEGFGQLTPQQLYPRS